MRFALFSIVYFLGTLTVIVAKSLRVPGWPYGAIGVVVIILTGVSGALLAIDYDKNKK